MTKRGEDLQFPFLGINLQDVAKAGGAKLTRSYCNLVSSMAGRESTSGSGGNQPPSGQSRKRVKKAQEDEPTVSSWALQCLNIATNEPDNTLYNKQLSRLRKNHVPQFCKHIGPIMDRYIHVETVMLSSNLKGWSKDWIIQYFNRTKLIQDGQLLGLQEPAIYMMQYEQFCRRFSHQLKDTSPEKWPAVFRGFCLEGESMIRWPVGIFQPLNFDDLEEVSCLTGETVIDDRVKLSFQAAPNDQAKLELTEIVSPQPERPVETIQQQQSEEVVVSAIPSQPDRNDSSKQKLIIWFVGTSHYSLEVLANNNLRHFNTQPEELWNQLITTTQFQLIRDDLQEMLQATNKSNKFFLNDIKNEEKRQFMHRFARRSKAATGTELYVIVRFKQVNEQRMILLKGLRTGCLFWAPTEQFQASYSLPQLTVEEMHYLYILEKLDPVFREQQICKLLLSQFYRQKVNMKQRIKEFVPNKEMVEPLRCFDCHYILADLPTVQCFFCGAYCHSRCLNDTTTQHVVKIGDEDLWCCLDCLPCSVCFGPIPDPLVCRHCQARFHRECGKTRDNLSEQAHYECEDCLACDMCEKKLKNCKEGYVLVEENIHCEECHSITGEYCRVCHKNWNKQHNPEWFQCNACEGWVHKLCDEGLLQTYAKYFSQPQSEYLCPKCRDVKRREYLKIVIEVLAKFDEYLYFVDPVYDSLIDYLDIIEHPMCFKKMQQRCAEGFYDTDSRKHIESDFNLIVNNALKYNMPKDLPHKSAKIMKLMGDTALDHFQQFMQLNDLELIESKDIRNKMVMRQRELFRYIYNHYLEILLNKGNFKSKVVVRNKSTADLPDLLYFKHSEFLRRFKTSTIDLVYAREPPTIDHLFSLPKSATESKKMSATRALCYYHNEPDIISSCSICCQAFCCVDRCFLHKSCTVCKAKGCRCYSWGCGCRAGYNPRDLENHMLRQYNNDILTITEMFKYCIKCSIANIRERECKYCYKLCSYSYIHCKKCQKIFHKACGRKIFIGQFCYECERLPENENKLKEQIKQETRKRLFKMIRVEKYVPHVLKCYLEEGIRMDAHQVRQLILQNYDNVEEHLDQLQCYQNSIMQIDKSKVREQKLRLMNETVAKHLPQLRSQLRLDECGITNTEMQFTLIDKHGRNIVKNASQHKVWEKYYFQNSLEQASNIADCTFMQPSMDLSQNVAFEAVDPPPAPSPEDSVQMLGFTYKMTMRLLYESTPLIRPKISTVTENRSNQMHDYKGNESVLRRIQDSREACRNLFMTFYYGMKEYPRFGSTSLVDLKQQSIAIYKKWQARSGLLIKLWKDNGKWMLRLDKEEYEVKDYNDLRQRLSKYRTFDSIEELGTFLGFNIRQLQKQSNTYIKFLQNNPLDAEPFVERKQKVMNFYDRVEHNHVERKELFFLNKKSQNVPVVSKRVGGKPYLSLEELTRELDDQPIAQKITLKLTDPTRQIFIAPSTIHKLGLFSRRNHPKNTVIIEYMGEILGEPIADIRESQFHLGCYMFGVPKRPQQTQKYTEDTVDEYTPHIPAKRDVIDATFRGNQARYLNHSCDPNCASRIQDHNGQPRILIYAIRDIRAFEQLTYDYQFKVSADQKIICTCGAKNCQGRLN